MGMWTRMLLCLALVCQLGLLRLQMGARWWSPTAT